MRVCLPIQCQLNDEKIAFVKHYNGLMIWNDTNSLPINPVIKVMVNRMEYLKIVEMKTKILLKYLMDSIAD
jgi:hypothetical protein